MKIMNRHYNVPPAARNLFEKRFLDLQKLLFRHLTKTMEEIDE
jgi:hypothetical protein